MRVYDKASPVHDLISRAAAALRDADAVVVTAGAGMSVDSGIPDYRSAGGFWRDYAPMQRLGFTDPKALGSARLLAADPLLFLGVQGHQRALFEATTPHEGYAALRRVIGARPHGVFTSNVDGAFAKAGFEPWRVVECHGSVARAQCTTPCSDHTWPMPHVAFDPDTLHAIEPLPRCPSCAALARPNACFFDDLAWVGGHSLAAQLRHYEWLRACAARGAQLVVIECGAGSELPVVRMHSHGLLRKGACLIRINCAEPDGPPGTLSLPLNARDALLAIASEFAASPPP
jgi:NAD-dependent SIR2 family protein deacetylase